MLKSLVPVFFSCFLLLTTLSAIADPGHSSPEVAKVMRSAAGNMNFTVSFVQPGRQVRKFIDAYIKNNDESLAMIRRRSLRPFTIIDSVLGHYDLPVELKYLAVIESELQSNAVSRVGARGPWQLMAGTARQLGLRVNGRSDERTNYYKSTKAAALYLRDLHREFGDWLLVLAAYNAGPVPVNRAIRLSHSHSFWALQRYLPAESRQHVKRFIATAYYFNLRELLDNPATEQLQFGQEGSMEEYVHGLGTQGGGLYPAESFRPEGYVSEGYVSEGYVEASGYNAAVAGDHSLAGQADAPVGAGDRSLVDGTPRRRPAAQSGRTMALSLLGITA